jgi:hypothetical protein
MEHLPGQLNVWADMLSRWTQPGYHDETKRKAHTIKVNSFRAEFLNLQYAALAPDLQLPSLKLIKEAQAVEHLHPDDFAWLRDNNEFVETKAGLTYFKGKVWIPSKNKELVLRHLITAHCGIAGHRGISVTLKNLEDVVYWEGMETDVQDFVRDTCLCCIKCKTGAVIPRAWGETLHATDRAKLLMFDFLYIGSLPKASKHDYQYILVLKDGYSGLVELIPCASAEHEIVVQSILLWCARGGYPELLQSDQGSHFKNMVMAELAKLMPAQHHFTLAYCPWSNGGVERVNKEIIPLLQILIMEHNMQHKGRQLQFHDWPYLLPLVMNVLNSSPSRRLGGRSPREVFMGLSQFKPVQVIYAPHLEHITTVPVTSKELEHQAARLHEALDAMHKRVDVCTERQQRHNKEYFLRRRKKDGLFKRNNAKARAKAALSGIDTDLLEDVDLVVDFQVGDFVMVATPVRPKNHKLEARWRGPYRVIRTINDYVYAVQHLVTSNVTEAHVRRMKFYCDAELDDLVPLCDHIASQEAMEYQVEELVKFRYSREIKQYEVFVKWLGFTDLENTWEPLSRLYEDVPHMVADFLEEKCSVAERNKLKTSLGVMA